MRCASQYEKLMRRKAFVDQYEQYGVLSVCLFYLGNLLDVKFTFCLFFAGWPNGIPKLT